MANQPTLAPARDGNETQDFLSVAFFSMEAAGKVKGFFQEVSGVQSENDVIEHKGVNEKGMEVVRKVPGRAKWGDVTLKRGVTSSLQLWEWRQMVIDGNVEKARTTVTIIMYDRAYKPVAEWHFYNAWPSKLSGPTFKADGSEFGVEEVTIVHEGMYRKK